VPFVVAINKCDRASADDIVGLRILQFAPVFSGAHKANAARSWHSNRRFRR
jgi:hypothetical protein